MVRIATLILFSFLLGGLQAQTAEEMVDICAGQAGEDATYLKDFQVKLGEPKEGRPQVARYPLVLSSNNIYRFSVCDLPDSEGKAVIKLYDNNRLIFSSYSDDTKEEFNPFNFGRASNYLRLTMYCSHIVMVSMLMAYGNNISRFCYLTIAKVFSSRIGVCNYSCSSF